MTPIEQTIPVLNTPPASTGLLAEPTFEECIEEGNHYFADRKANRLDLDQVPEGHYLVYYAGKIHDHDQDPIALQNRVAARLSVHWARLVIDYPWEW